MANKNNENETLNIDAIQQFKLVVEKLEFASYIKNTTDLNELLIILESPINKDNWQIVHSCFKIIIQSNHDLKYNLVNEFIPSLIWAHINSISSKQPKTRNKIAKIIANIYNDTNVKEGVKKFEANLIDDSLIETSEVSDKIKYFEMPKEDAPSQLSSSNILNCPQFYNSNVWNCDKYIYGVNGLPCFLQSIPLSQCLPLYGFLMTFYGYNLRNVSNISLMALFRLCLRISRTGYSSKFFSSDEMAELISKEEFNTFSAAGSIRINLSNYFVKRIAFGLLRGLYKGLGRYSKICADNLLTVCMKQQLNAACAVLLSLIHYQESLNVKDAGLFMINPNIIKT